MTLSVVVISYNDTHGLRRTIASLASIDWGTAPEIHIVDGGTVGILAEDLSGLGIPVASITSEQDDGIADAWNKGIRRCSSGPVMLLNSGDRLLAVDRSAEWLQTSPLGYRSSTIGVSDVLVEGSNSRSAKLVALKRPYPLALGVGFLHPGMVASKEIYETVGYYDTSLKIASDCEWILRARAAGVRFERSGATVSMEYGGVSVARRSNARTEYRKALKGAGRPISALASLLVDEILSLRK